MKRFAAVIYETARWANTHHTETAAVLAKYAKVDPDTVNTMIRTQYAESLRMTDLQPTLDAAVKFGVRGSSDDQLSYHQGIGRPAAGHGQPRWDGRRCRPCRSLPPRTRGRRRTGGTSTTYRG